MKKFLFASLLVTLSFVTYAQPKIGLTFAPGISMNRVKYSSTTDVIDKYGSRMKMSFGLEADFKLTDSYAFSTGLIFTPKRVGFKIAKANTSTIREVYNMQYLQLPISLKLYTTEIQPDLRPFFHIGFLAEVKVFDEPNRPTYDLVDDFKFYDASFLGGMGVEYGAGVNTVLYLGLYYSRGLVNIVKSTTDPADDILVAKMDAFNVRLGIKF